VRAVPADVAEVENRGVTTVARKNEEDEVRVLFVEDDPTVAQMYRLKLELDGYSVDVASDGEQALSRATSDPPDIVFLDIRLPKLDGLGVLAALRRHERTRQVPVVLLSNYSERELVERGLKLGALEYLVKSQTTPARVAGGVEDWLKT
jgi:DNA-binding response OmpR family regulator